MLTVTGSLDGDVLGNGATPEQRMALFDHLPAGQKARLVLHNADHFTFSGQTDIDHFARARAQVAQALQTQHHRVVAQLSTGWCLATLHREAQTGFLQPVGLASGDRWDQG